MTRALLATLLVLSLGWAVCAASIPPYRRADYKHWVDADRDCQDTRQEVLIAESIEPPMLTPDTCRVVSGVWLDPYTGQRFTDPRLLDVDHRVPLANAHRSGAWLLSRAQKQSYANDLRDPDHLVAVSARANRQKSDKGPEAWMPPENRCAYVAAWVQVKTAWRLTLTAAEHAAIVRELEACP